MIDSRPTYKPMRVQAGPSSPAAAYYGGRSAGGTGYGALASAALANNLRPAPYSDLIYRGGKLVPQMRYQNVYLGARASWHDDEKRSIDHAIKVAMQDRRLNSVLTQYFQGRAPECDPLDSLSLDEAGDAVILDEADITAKVVELYTTKKISHRDLDVTIFNLMLPRGTELHFQGHSSREEIGGYHGSTKVVEQGRSITLYYSANVYSDAGNGLEAFDRAWKNVVATLYHELNEFRTDPDVGEAGRVEDPLLGWVSNLGEEIGDQPIYAADKNLSIVFKEILANEERIPVQLLYSNAVHGAEEPSAG